MAFELVATNLGPDAATGVTVTDELPECTEYQSDDCGGAQGPPWAWSIGDLAVDGSATCTVMVNASGCLGEGPQTNVATVAGNETESNPDNNEDDAGFEIAADMVDLTIEKTATVQDDGTTVAFALQVTNLGPNDATGVAVTDTLPECVEYRSDDCDGAAGPPWTWSIGALAADASATCTVMVDAGGCLGEGPQTNVATVAGNETESNPDNNDDDVEFDLMNVPALPMIAALLLALLLVITAQRVDVGDAQAVGDQRASGRAAAGADPGSRASA